MSPLIENIKKLCAEGKVRYTRHMLIRLMQRNISIADIEYALQDGILIEEYKGDTPYPSCLVLGYDIAGKCIHVVCGASKSEVHLITAYYPDILKWNDDFTTRKEHK